MFYDAITTFTVVSTFRLRTSTFFNIHATHYGYLDSKYQKTKKRSVPKRYALTNVGIDLFFRGVSAQVFSAQMSLTTVFGKGTGGPSSS